MFIAAQQYLWQTKSGRIVRIDCNDPTIQLAFEGGELSVIGAFDRPVKVTRLSPRPEPISSGITSLTQRTHSEIAMGTRFPQISTSPSWRRSRD
jgi:hypothetical protein